MKKIARELADTYRFFFATPLVYKRIVFYLEHQGYYPYVEGIMTELRETHRQPLSYITSDYTDPLLTKRNPAIHVFYFHTLLPYVMALLKAQVCVMTVADLERFSLRRSAYPVHYVYVFHALVSTHMMYREGAFDYYDTLLCVGPHQIAEIRAREQQESLPPKHLVEAGYHPLERIYEAHQRRSAGARSEKKTVLIAPSWGADNVLESVGEALIKKLLSTGYEVIVRPHSETQKHSPALLKSFIDQFGGNASFTLETLGAPDASLVRADVLISDCSGIMFEYAFGTERPVLSIDVPPKVKNPNFKKLDMEPVELTLRAQFGVVISPRDIDTIDNVIEKLIAEKDAYRARIQALRSRYVSHFGNAAAVSAREIMARSL